jgi:hypothetical protein
VHPAKLITKCENSKVQSNSFIDIGISQCSSVSTNFEISQRIELIYQRVASSSDIKTDFNSSSCETKKENIYDKKGKNPF